MKKYFFAFILVLIFTSSFYAQNKLSGTNVFQNAKPETQGFDSERLKKIDLIMQEYVDKKWLAGVVSIVARNGKIVYHKAIGYNDLVAKTPMQRDAIFRIASQTKAITAVAAMMLYEDGKFLLDDPISKYIPEFKNPKVIDKYNESDTTYTTIKAKREITIRDLLTHSSGLGYAQIGDKMMNAIYFKAGVIGGIGVDKIILKDCMKKLATLPLKHQPGAKWTYGLNSDVLGYLVEVVSGMSLSDYFQNKIFKPLGMNDTYFYIPKEKKHRLANLFSEDSNKTSIKAKEIDNMNGVFYRDYPILDGTYFSGGGGLSSTALDYAIFLQMLLNGGEYNGKRILSRNAVRIMATSQLADSVYTYSTSKMGLGFSIVNEAGSAKSLVPEGVFSWGGMFGSTYWIDPKEKIVAQFFVQQYPFTHRDIQEKFKVLVYQALK
jgi:CubicO group peptidase (beta-lactamase class C family)